MGRSSNRHRADGQRGAALCETGQQELRHGEFRGPCSDPMLRHGITAAGPPGWPICWERHPLQNNRRRWPGTRPWWSYAGSGCTGVLRHGLCAEGAGRGSAAVGRLIRGQEALWVAGCQLLRVAPPGCGLPSKVPRTGGWAARPAAQ
jgi:hypothetical protein